MSCVIKNEGSTVIRETELIPGLGAIIARNDARIKEQRIEEKRFEEQRKYIPTGWYEAEAYRLGRQSKTKKPILRFIIIADSLQYRNVEFDYGSKEHQDIYECMDISDEYVSYCIDYPESLFNNPMYVFIKDDEIKAYHNIERKPTHIPSDESDESDQIIDFYVEDSSASYIYPFMLAVVIGSMLLLDMVLN